jgi:hypothetical protein
MGRKHSTKPKRNVVAVRFTDEELTQIDAAAAGGERGPWIRLVAVAKAQAMVALLLGAGCGLDSRGMTGASRAVGAPDAASDVQAQVETPVINLATVPADSGIFPELTADTRTQQAPDTSPPDTLPPDMLPPDTRPMLADTSPEAPTLVSPPDTLPALSPDTQAPDTGTAATPAACRAFSLPYISSPVEVVAIGGAPCRGTWTGTSMICFRNCLAVPVNYVAGNQAGESIPASDGVCSAPIGHVFRDDNQGPSVCVVDLKGCDAFCKTPGPFTN